MTDKNKLISVIIVNWNGEKWLGRCLDSLVNQTYKNIELILVDNSSIDNSVNFVRNKYPSVRILKSENRGFGFSCNYGARESHGKFLMFFNEDMYVDDDFVEKYLVEYKKIAGNKNIGTVGCMINNYDKTKVYKKEPYGYSIDLIATPVANFVKKRIFHNTGCPLFISRDLFLKIGGFCENIFIYGEDVDICWRLNLYGYKHYFFQNIAIYHNNVSGSLSKWKISYYIKGEINCMLNNYSTLLLTVGLVYFGIFYISLSVVFLISGNLELFKTIYESVWNELTSNFGNIMSYRKRVQSNRVVSDLSLLGKINIVPSRPFRLFYVNRFKYCK